MKKEIQFPVPLHQPGFDYANFNGQVFSLNIMPWQEMKVPI
jgi:hypothetical protein